MYGGPHPPELLPAPRQPLQLTSPLQSAAGALHQASALPLHTPLASRHSRTSLEALQMLATRQTGSRLSCPIRLALLTGPKGLKAPSSQGRHAGAVLAGRSRQADAPAGGPQQQMQLRRQQLH